MFMKKNNKKGNTRGSVTIEASIVLPFFLCVVITVAFFIKVIYTHEIIQHALNQTANEISQLSYIYHISGINEFFGEFEEELFQKPDGELNKLPDIPEELREELYALIKGMYEDDLNKLFSTLAKIYMRKYFMSSEAKDPDERLRKLNIDGGIDGLDMSMSGFFANDRNDIDLVVKYMIDIPIPIKIFPPLCFIQRAAVRAWLYGDEKIESEEDIWSLDNFTRGRKIREIFGANLPFNFPVIAKFSSGTATMIKSMDLTAKSYQEPEITSKKIQVYINELAEYNGQEKPWGQGGIVIKREEINKKELLLVIPENPIGNGVIKSLEECKIYASGRGVVLRIERYGYKKEVSK